MISFTSWMPPPTVEETPLTTRPPMLCKLPCPVFCCAGCPPCWPLPCCACFACCPEVWERLCCTRAPAGGARGFAASLLGWYLPTAVVSNWDTRTPPGQWVLTQLSRVQVASLVQLQLSCICIMVGKVGHVESGQRVRKAQPVNIVRKALLESRARERQFLTGSRR